MKLHPLIRSLLKWLTTPGLDKPEPVEVAKIPPGPCWFALDGWSIERQLVVGNGFTAYPHCWISPNRKHVMPWLSRVTPRTLRPRCSPSHN